MVRNAPSSTLAGTWVFGAVFNPAHRFHAESDVSPTAATSDGNWVFFHRSASGGHRIRMAEPRVGGTSRDVSAAGLDEWGARMLSVNRWVIL